MFKEINILKIFFEDPSKEFNVREIARIAKITAATASKRLKEFKKKEILQHRKERILDLYSANLDSDSYKDVKLYYILRSIKESGFIDKLNEFYLKPTIILFGSASEGLDTKDSDIDLAIITERKKELTVVKNFESKLKRKIQLFICKDLKDIKNEHLINNILNGITLQGEVRWT